MDKRFDQFPYQAPTGTRLILHADPTTGSIRNAPVSEFTGGGSSNDILELESQVVNSVAATDVNVIDFNFPANTFDANGKGFEFYINCSTSGGSSSRTIKAKFEASTTNIIDSVFAFTMMGQGCFVRRSSSSMILTAVGMRSGANPLPNSVIISSLDFTAITNFKLQINSTNNDEIASQTAYIKKLNY